jgi:hypothetical protein
MISNKSEPLSVNSEKSLALATALFPDEEWIAKEPNIWVAKSRLIQKKMEPKKWEREMSQVRILTSRGNVAYFLPEKKIQGESGNLCADLVFNGEVLEMKKVSGTRTTLGGKFRYGYKQGALLLKNCNLTKKHSVFIWLLSDISEGSVKAKIAGELKNRHDEGAFICFMHMDL